MRSKRLFLRRDTRRIQDLVYIKTNLSPSFLSQQQCSFSKISKSSSVNDPASSAGLQNSLLKAPFQRLAQPPLFPWRHEEVPLDRLIPGSEEFQEKGYLLGGNVMSSNPMFDAYATAYLFLDLPLYKLLFFSHWQADLAENMSWAFAQAMAGVLSNVYQGT